MTVVFHRRRPRRPGAAHPEGRADHRRLPGLPLRRLAGAAGGGRRRAGGRRVLRHRGDDARRDPCRDRRRPRPGRGRGPGAFRRPDPLRRHRRADPPAEGRRDRLRDRARRARLCRRRRRARAGADHPRDRPVDRADPDVDAIHRRCPRARAWRISPAPARRWRSTSRCATCARSSGCSPRITAPIARWSWPTASAGPTSC